MTLVHEPSTSTWAKGIKIIPTFLNKIPFVRKRHEVLAPLAPLAFETLDFSGYDIVISVTGSDAKSIITKPNQLHICYCLTPTRYFWSGETEYDTNWKMRIIPKFLKEYFKNVDILTSERPDEYISISEEIRDRVNKFYRRKSVVIYPPIEDKFYSKKIIPLEERGYYLIVGRLVPYKKVDLVISVFNKLNLPLKVVGTGSEVKRLRKMAGKSITFDKSAGDQALIEYYRHAKAVIFPPEEDFGLVPLEAQASGTPVIAYGKGGALETVIDKKTGILFSKQTESSLTSAIRSFEKIKFSPQACVVNARKFNQAKFTTEFSSEVNKLWTEFSNKK